MVEFSTQDRRLWVGTSQEALIFTLSKTLYPLLSTTNQAAGVVDITSGSEITPCNIIDKPPLVYRFSGNVHNNVAYIMTK